MRVLKKLEYLGLETLNGVQKPEVIKYKVFLLIKTNICLVFLVLPMRILIKCGGGRGALVIFLISIFYLPGILLEKYIRDDNPVKTSADSDSGFFCIFFAFRILRIPDSDSNLIT